MQVLAVSFVPTDDDDAIRSYKEQYEFPWPMAPTSLEMITAYGVRAQSTKFAIDADGIIAYTKGYGNAGEAEWIRILESVAPAS